MSPAARRPLPNIDNIASAREQAEEILAAARERANQVRVEHARAVLREAFPSHSLAVFARYDDQQRPALIQLLSDDPDATDVDIQEKDAWDGLPAPGREAVEIANTAIGLIGDDEEIWRHLDAGSEQHENWYEFDLELDLGSVGFFAPETIAC